MPELTETAVAAPSPEMVSLLENLQKKNLSGTSLQNIINSSSSTSSVQETSSSQQVNLCFFLFYLFFAFSHLNTLRFMHVVRLFIFFFNRLTSFSVHPFSAII